MHKHPCTLSLGFMSFYLTLYTCACACACVLVHVFTCRQYLMDLLVLLLYDGQQLGLLVKQPFLGLLLLLDDLQQHCVVVLALCVADAVRDMNTLKQLRKDRTS